MIVKEHKLKFGRGQKETAIMYGSCWHIGNPNCRHDAIDTFMEKAKTMPWWHVGDMIESILPNDPRFSVTEHKEATTHNLMRASSACAKASKTCVGILTGNHEWKASAKVGDVSEMIAHDARVPYLGGVAYIDFKAPDGTCRVFTAHGRGSMGFNSGNPERDDTNRRVKLRRDYGKWEADVKCFGHYHRTIVAPPVNVASGMVRDGKFVRDYAQHDPSWIIACPSLFANYEDGTTTSYAEIALFPPTDLGWIEIVIRRDGTVRCVREINEDGAVDREHAAMKLA